MAATRPPGTAILIAKLIELGCPAASTIRFRGAIMVAAHEKNISRMHGLGRTMPVTFAAFLIGSLSIVGLPPAGGVWSKWFLGLGTLEAGQVGLLAVLMLSTLLGLYYLLEVPVKAFFFPAVEGAHHGEGIKEAPTPSLIAICITAAVTVLLFFWPELGRDLMAMVVAGGGS